MFWLWFCFCLLICLFKTLSLKVAAWSRVAPDASLSWSWWHFGCLLEGVNGTTQADEQVRSQKCAFPQRGSACLARLFSCPCPRETNEPNQQARDASARLASGGSSSVCTGENMPRALTWPLNASQTTQQEHSWFCRWLFDCLYWPVCKLGCGFWNVSSAAGVQAKEPTKPAVSHQQTLLLPSSHHIQAKREAIKANAAERQRDAANKSSYSHQAEPTAAIWKGRQEDTDAPLQPPSDGALFLPAASFLGHMAPAGNLLGCLHIPHWGASRAGRETAHPTGSAQAGGEREGANYCHSCWCSEEYQRVINGISNKDEMRHILTLARGCWWIWHESY